MEYLDMNITLNKDKSIGKVLYIVEGGSTEPYILRKIFTQIFDYQYETLLRDKNYKQYNSKVNPHSKIFVINAEESNIKNIDKDNDFLNNLFAELITNYDFDIDNAAIYYLFDRDNQSNTDVEMIRSFIGELVNARDNPDYIRQGLLLLSYPSVESFTLSNFLKNSFDYKFSLGSELKQFLHNKNINHQQVSAETLLSATNEMVDAFGVIGVDTYNLDNFRNCNMTIFNYEEDTYEIETAYRALSLVCISLIDLGLVEVE